MECEQMQEIDVVILMDSKLIQMFELTWQKLQLLWLVICLCFFFFCSPRCESHEQVWQWSGYVRMASAKCVTMEMEAGVLAVKHANEPV